jgi:hypothetical protein
MIALLSGLCKLQYQHSISRYNISNHSNISLNVLFLQEQQLSSRADGTSDSSGGGGAAVQAEDTAGGDAVVGELEMTDMLIVVCACVLVAVLAMYWFRWSSSSVH